jgi:nucleoside-diphosphate-sugar epimerase
MQTILGAKGVIATELAKNLVNYTNHIRLVSRNPQKVNPTDEIVQADLTSFEQTLKAIEDSEVAYLTVGLKYNIRVWQSTWPVIMRNVIEACKKTGSRLVFFDNVYMYGKVDGWMTENTAINPCSRKGEVRAKIAEMLMDEVSKGNLNALIARSADFYGPNTPLSFVNVMVFDNLKKGKKPQWMLNDLALHSFTYTPDAGKATALLGNTPDAFNQVWHLPSDRNLLSGKDFIKLAAEAYGLSANYMLLKKWMIRMAGMFNPVIHESIEMLYQSEFDYRFDSSKFEQAFKFTPVRYAEGIAITSRS